MLKRFCITLLVENAVLSDPGYEKFLFTGCKGVITRDMRVLLPGYEDISLVLYWWFAL